MLIRVATHWQHESGRSSRSPGSRPRRRPPSSPWAARPPGVADFPVRVPATGATRGDVGDCVGRVRGCGRGGGILTPIWHTKPVIAKTVKQRIHTVLEWAIAMNLRTDNPSDRVGPVLGPQRNIVQHMRALPHREVAAALATVRTSGAPQAVTLAFEFLVLTAARSGEVRLAAWDEMDTADHVWTIPATRMKMKRDHRVPLCGRALAILAAARTLGDGPLVFPSRSGRRLAVPQLRLLLARCGIACVPHGFRSSFRDWAAEETDHPREVVEAALAHRVQNPVEAAYARSDLFERRRRLMDDWAAYLTGERRPEESSPR